MGSAVSFLSTIPAPVDYTPPSSSLTIASGATQECITVTSTNDNILEDDESFDIILSAASDPDVTVTTDTTTVTIIEDTDSVAVGFTETSYTIEEGMSMPAACVSVGGVLERDITVTVSSMDDSAIGKPSVVYATDTKVSYRILRLGGHYLGIVTYLCAKQKLCKSCPSGVSIAALRLILLGFGS